MKHKPNIGYLLYTMDAGYHASGTIREDGKLVARFYKCDRLTDDNLAEIRKYYPGAKRMRSGKPRRVKKSLRTHRGCRPEPR